MTSTKTLIPIDYYRLPFCRPADGPKVDHENLGEFLAGDRIESSPYQLYMKQDMYCEQICYSNLGRPEQAGISPNKVVQAIRKNYHNNWIVDNLPAASKVEDDVQVTTRYWQGFPVGFISEKDMKAYIHNHVNIEIMYHAVETEADRYRVVRFTVHPFSIHHEYELVDGDILDAFKLPKVAKIINPIASCDPKMSIREHTNYDMVVAKNQKPQEASGRVLFTYDVIWIENPYLSWASRWDIYLSMDGTVPARIHWLQIATSLVIFFVLSAMIAIILVHNLRGDINRYNKVAMDEESRAEELEKVGWKLVHADEEARAEELEKSGWNLVHADVFRPPSFSPMLLAVSCGAGAQLLFMTFFTIIFLVLGFMSPSSRGHLLMGMLLFFVLMGGVNGYVTARLYNTFKGKACQRATTTAALGLPGFVFGLCFMKNIVALAMQSTYAVPFVTMLILVILWFGILTPLVYLGAYFGYKQDAIEFPVSTSSIPRRIPFQPYWFASLGAVGGFLSFFSCFVELYYIMSSVWMYYYYCVYGFLFLVFVILVVICAEIAVLLTYFQLCREDYRWWWRSFCNGGSIAIIVFLYFFVYFRQLEATSLATYILYFGYMGLVSIGLFLMMGFIGLSTSLWFNMTIYGSITVDHDK
jgi:transmembrane 9 superfamily member 2/4